jgi:hypothetical protein
MPLIIPATPEPQKTLYMIFLNGKMELRLDDYGDLIWYRSDGWADYLELNWPEDAFAYRYYNGP